MTTPIISAEEFADMTGLTVDEARRELEDFGAIEPSNTVTVAELPNCDICSDGTKAKYDARIPGMSWANLCASHFMMHGCTLGVGSGQELVVG